MHCQCTTRFSYPIIPYLSSSFPTGSFDMCKQLDPSSTVLTQLSGSSTSSLFRRPLGTQNPNPSSHPSHYAYTPQSGSHIFLQLNCASVVHPFNLTGSAHRPLTLQYICFFVVLFPTPPLWLSCSSEDGESLPTMNSEMHRCSAVRCDAVTGLGRWMCEDAPGVGNKMVRYRVLRFVYLLMRSSVGLSR